MITTMMQCDEYQELRDEEQRQIDFEYEMEALYYEECMMAQDWEDNEIEARDDDEYHELNAMECGYTLYTPLDHQAIAREFGFILN